MSVLTIPNSFSNGTPADGNLVNQNFSAVAAAVNNINSSNVGALGIYASQLIPTSSAQATFGGTLGYTFLAPSTGVTPLVASGIAGQSANIFQATLTSGGIPAFAVDKSGIVYASALASVSAPGSAALGDLVAQRSATSGVLQIGGATRALEMEFGTLQNGQVTLQRFNAGSGTDLGFTVFGNITAQAAFSATSFPTASLDGDIIAARTTATGQYWAGGAASSGGWDFNITNGGGITFKTGAGGFIPLFAGAYTNSSDATLKANVQPVADALISALALKPVSFDWKHDGSSSLGFLAQDVQSILPQLVSTDHNGSMGVNYDGIIPVCVAAIQELTAQFSAYVTAHP